MSPTTSLLRADLRRHRRAVGATALAAAVVVSGLATAPGAASAPSTACPSPYPVDQVARDQAVSGLTVTRGTDPTSFTGTVIGVIDDGIAPGLDMVMAELSSPEIDRVGGIWQGMSGSPVYAADGRLIGAVAYGLAWGPSPVAGITPAAEMYRLMDQAPADPAARRAVRTAAAGDDVPLPRRLARELVASGAEPRQVSGGMSRLPVPLGISGMLGAGRLQQAQKAFGLDGTRVHQGAAVTDRAEPLPIVAGGNLAASLSYGDVSAVGVGTATAVCGDEVVAFGHPMTFSGPSSLTLHGADAVYIQEDPVAAPFKMANPGAPAGVVSQDRLAGLVGLIGQAKVPDTTDVTSFVRVPGEWSRTGTTHISVPDAVPDIAAMHLLADQDRVFDGIGPGSADVGWVVKGHREDGTPFTLTRNDVYASEFDISFESTFDLFDALFQMQHFPSEDVTLDDISTSSLMTRDQASYSLGTVHVLAQGRWQKVRADRPMMLRGGTTKRFRVALKSVDLAAKVVYLRLPVPRNVAGKFGFIEVLGGNSDFPGGGGEGFPGEESLDESTAPATFDALLRRLRNQPTNDEVIARLTLFRRDGSALTRSARKATGSVVDGVRMVEVQGVR
jgi:hypothetical protein